MSVDSEIAIEHGPLKNKLMVLFADFPELCKSLPEALTKAVAVLEEENQRERHDKIQY